MNESNQPDPQHAGFCQICGRAVASESDRLAGRAFPCGLCNEVKLASPASTGYVYPGTEAGAPSGFGAGAAGAAPPGVPGPIPPTGLPPRDVPNPGLAALLGIIPGVGAMYNGQYAKGIVHLVIFAVLTSLADSNGIFGLFVIGWVAYQSIEAHHTARARRDGLPLPNPFGLNDIGERLGFGKAWPFYPATPPAGTATPDPSSAAAPFGAAPPMGAPGQPAASSWGAPWESYRQNAPFPPVTPYAPPYGQPVPPYAPPYAQPHPPYTPVNAGYTGGVPPFGNPPFDGQDYVPQNPYDQPYPVPRNRFPAGAIWLIALGTLFLLNTSGLFRDLHFHLLLPLLFFALGVWLFVHRMTRTGLGLADDGSAGYRIRVFRAARGAVWLILLGVIFFLADFNILPWSRSWPLYIILAGIMLILERTVYNNAGPVPPAYGYPPYTPATPPSTHSPASAPPVSIGPTESSPSQENQEGR
jgi:hypothetical protein